MFGFVLVFVLTTGPQGQNVFAERLQTYPTMAACETARQEWIADMELEPAGWDPAWAQLMLPRPCRQMQPPLV